MSDSEEEFIDVKGSHQPKDYENTMAWGTKKANFYQSEESEYSQIEQEESEAQNIINKYAEDVQDEDFDLPNQALISNQILVDSALPSDNTAQISMLKAEIKKMFKRLRMFDGVDISDFDEVFKSGKMNLLQEYTNVHQAYIMTMLVLMRMYQQGVKHLEESSVMVRLEELKGLCGRFHKHHRLVKEILQSADRQLVEQEEVEQEDNHKSRGHSEADRREQNLQKYNDLVAKHKKIKKDKLKEKKIEKIASLPSKPFEEVTERQARSINYTILKNKGLTRRRSKKPKSSRANNRLKFQKKMVKYRSAHPMHKDPGLSYQGETDIKQGKITSVKIT